MNVNYQKRYNLIHAMPYIQRLKIISYIPVQYPVQYSVQISRRIQKVKTKKKSTVSCTQTRKCIRTVSTILQATDIHALLAHMGMGSAEWAGYRRRTGRCLHAHDAQTGWLLRLWLEWLLLLDCL